MLTAMDKRIKKMKLNAQFRKPTVKVEADTDLGYVIMNKEDFDPDEHTLFKGEEPEKSTESPDQEPEGDDLDEMNVADLDDVIEEEELDVDATLRKAEKIEAIRAARVAAEEEEED